MEFTEGRHKDIYIRHMKRGILHVPDEEKELIYSYNLIPVTAEYIYNQKP